MRDPTDRPIVIGIDGGGTHTRGVAVARDGTILTHARRSAANPRTVGTSRGAAEVEATVRELRAAAPGPVMHLVLGSAGRVDEASPEESRAVAERLGVAAAIVDSDARIAHAAAFGRGDGAVVVAGTGSQCLAFGTGGDRVRVGGWGPDFGDEGSAHWIACKAMRRALRKLDEGRTDGLVDALLDFAEVDPALAEAIRNERLLDRLYGPHTGPADRARFALQVEKLARDGHPEAWALLAEAGAALADLAILAAERAGTRRIACAGSVLDRNRTVRASFETALAHAGLVLAQRRWEPVLGAAYLALGAAGWDADAAATRWSRATATSS